MNSNNTTPLVIVFLFLILLDLLVIGGILWKGQANFIELYKHLKQ